MLRSSHDDQCPCSSKLLADPKKSLSRRGHPQILAKRELWSCMRQISGHDDEYSYHSSKLLGGCRYQQWVVDWGLE